MKSGRFALPILLAVAFACGGGAGAAAPSPDPFPRFFQNADVRLAFTLDLPPGRGPFPAVVTAHGSGKMTRA